MAAAKSSGGICATEAGADLLSMMAIEARSAALATEDCAEAEAMEAAALVAASAESVIPLAEAEAAVNAEMV